MRIYLTISLFLLCAGYGLSAQSGVLVTNTDQNGTVWLKWLTETIYTQEPVNVYRRESGTTQWAKLNATPINRLPEVPNLQRGVPESEMMELAEDIVLQYSFADQQETMVQLFLLTQIFDSNDFSRFLGIFYEDATARPGVSYEYRVVSLGRNGQEREIGVTEPLTVERWAGLAPPKGIRGLALENSAALSWNPEEERYFSVNVYRDSFPNNPVRPRFNDVPVVPSKVPNENGLLVYPSFFFQEDSLQNGTTYYYQLTAVDFFGRESDRSPATEIVPLDMTPPDPITDLRVSRTGPLTSRLRWTRTFGRDLIGYQVYRAASFDAEVLEPVSEILPKNTSKWDDTVPAHGDYLYYVATVDAAGNLSPSNIGVISMRDATPPQVPQNVVATPGRGTITLSWDAVPDGDLAGYQVFRSIRDGKADRFAPLQADPVVGEVYIDSLPLNAKNEFFYRVLAVDQSFNKSELSESAVTAMPDVVPPVPPAIKNATVLGDTVLLTWFPSMSEDVTGYELERATGADSTAFVRTGGDLLPAGATTYANLKLQRGTDYRYRLRATDRAGNRSDWSNVWAVRTALPPQQAATESLSTSYSKRNKSVQIKWNPPRNGTARGYMLYRRPADGTRFTPVSGMLAPGTKIFKDTNVEPDRAYTYQLRVFYEDGRMARTGTDNVQTR